MSKGYLTIIKLSSVLFLLLATTGISSAGAFGTVVIDPGHGGKDIGGSYGKVYEKHLALDTAKRVEYLLKKQGYRTRMTRDSDYFITLQKRASIGNSYSNSIFVSIHYNYTYKRHVKGIETFYYSSRSKSLAQYIHNATLRKTSATNRGVKFARYYVIRHAKNPAVLVEGGFVSNSSECRDCKRGNYRQDIAEGIVEGINHYQSARRSGRVR